MELTTIVADEKEIIVRGQYRHLVGAIKQKLGSPAVSGVPSFGPNWLPFVDSFRKELALISNDVLGGLLLFRDISP